MFIIKNELKIIAILLNLVIDKFEIAFLNEGIDIPKTTIINVNAIMLINNFILSGWRINIGLSY